MKTTTELEDIIDNEGIERERDRESDRERERRKGEAFMI